MSLEIAESNKEIEVKAVSKVMRRLVPVAMLLYVLNYLDRVNISFAKLQMNAELGFSDAVYGFGASIFFVGYFVFELPSNMMMQRVGARLWISRIMISWGLVSTAMMFIHDPFSFYVLRFLLGVAEAGFFPAIILYFTYWIPASYRARNGAFFLTSLAFAGVIGGPIAGFLLGISAFGVSGWQWLFILEGLPTIIVGFLVLVLLPDRPQQAKWLNVEEQQALVKAVESEYSAQRPEAHSFKFAIANCTMWLLSLLYGCMIFGFYGLGYWTPSIIKQVSQGSTEEVGWLSAIPYAAAIVGMMFIGHISDGKKSQLHVAGFSLLIGAAGMLSCAFCSSTFGTIASLSLAAIGIYGSLAPFWTVPPTFLRGSAVAAAIAIINSIGNLAGGLVGPNIMGQLRDSSKSYSSGLVVTAVVLAVAAILSSILGGRMFMQKKPQ